MERCEERHARDLHEKLVTRMGFANPDVEITLSGAGVHWNCFVALAKRSVVVHCFNALGEEYLSIFNHYDKEVATARTPSSDKTVDVVEGWIRGQDLSTLYDNFSFVDSRKRELTFLANAIVEHASGLENQSNLQYRGSGIYDLWFRSGPRSTLIHFYGNEDTARVICSWDECPLFSFRAADVLQTSSVLKLWLCDQAMPSTMRKEFSWLTIGRLADYYENGNPVEGEFINSWDQIEQFYDNDKFASSSRVSQFIAQLREEGYDQKLRAGQSLMTFILSRSRRHGLRSEQPRIRFEFSWNDDLMNATLQNGCEQSTLTARILLSGEIRGLLNQMVELPID